MNSKIIQLINDYWRFDNDQDNLSTWHDKNDLIKEIEAINFTDSSIQLKEKYIPTFEEWLKKEGYKKQVPLFYIKQTEQFKEKELLKKYNNDIKNL